MEEDENRDDLEPADPHVEGQVDLDRIGEVSVVAERADVSQARTDVAEGRDAGGHSGGHVRAGQAQDADAQGEQDEVEEQEGNDGVDHVVGHSAAIEAQRPYGAGEDRLKQLDQGRLRDQPYPDQLRPAGRGTAAAAAEHEQQQDRLACLSPEREVLGRESGRRDDRERLEARAPQRVLRQGVGRDPLPQRHVVALERAGQKQGRADDDHKVEPELLASQQGQRAAADRLELEGVVCSGEEHEGHHRPLDQAAVVAADAARVRGEAPGRDGAQGVADRVEGRHAEPDQETRFQRGQTDVQRVQVEGRVADAGGKALLRGPGCFGEEHLAAGDAQRGQHGDEEGDDAHAADPLAQGSPQEDAFAHRVEVGEDRGAGAGQARHRLEERVGGCEAVRGVGDGADQNEQQPGDGHGRQAFHPPHLESPPGQEPGSQTQQNGEAGGGEEGEGAAPVPVGRLDRGRRQQDRTETADQRQGRTENDRDAHSRPSRLRASVRRPGPPCRRPRP